MKKIVVILTLGLLNMVSANAITLSCMNHGKKSGEFLPKNNIQIAVGDKIANDMTKEKFYALIERVESLFQPSFAKVGAVLKVNRRWDDPAVDANASQWPNGNWRVSMYGGLARHPLINDDGFMMVLCHEIGHHIGGAPRSNDNTYWSSAEGQSDYFASLKCFRRVIENDDNITIVKSMQIDPTATQRCQEIYKSPQDIALCQRVAMAGKTVAVFIASKTETPNIQLTTPDNRRVSKTNEDHPDPQCRLDTYFQGSLCDKSLNEEVSHDDPSVGTCHAKAGFKIGLRPTCWYKPSSNEL